VELKPEGVFRSVYPPYSSEILAFLGTPLAARLVEQRRVVASEVVNPDRNGEPLLLRHPRVSFVSYPAEWSPILWLAAAELTVTLCAELLEGGWILKDATPLNILFQGTTPVFVDILSIQRVDLGLPIWYAYGQFVRTFLLPMLAHSQLGWPLQSVLSRRDGFEPEEIYAVLPWTRRFMRPALTSVTLPKLLAKKSATLAADMTPRMVSDPDLTKQIIGNTLSGLRTAMQRAMPSRRSSVWSNYLETASHYSPEDHADKQRFIASVFTQYPPKRVLDVGCNTGAYSKLAADAGAEVVSIDADINAVDRFCAELRETDRNILPLCVDFAHPTPSTGWENYENASFLQRAEGHFDTLLMLAVLHHLLLSSQIPLGHIASLCSRITTKHLLIEWVPPTDPRFIEVLRGREALYRNLTESSFRHAFTLYFDAAQEITLSNGRILLHLRKR
jgi:SAM-dependent methyltransferase